MDDLAIFLEHVDLLDGWDGLGINLLQGVGKLSLLAGRVLAGLLDLSAHGAFATNAGLRLQLGQLLSINPRHSTQDEAWCLQMGLSTLLRV